MGARRRGATVLADRRIDRRGIGGLRRIARAPEALSADVNHAMQC
jgi:hypothetical protein